jgi:hypothetical protein
VLVAFITQCDGSHHKQDVILLLDHTQKDFLGAFAEIAKNAFYTKFCVSPHISASSGQIFMKFGIVIFKKLRRKIPNLVKNGQ